MSCRDNEDALEDAAAGGPVTAALGAHLEACAACRERLEAWRRRLDAIEGSLAVALDVAPSAGFAARLRERLADEDRRGRRTASWLPALAAGIVVAAVGGWLLLGRDGAPARSPDGGSSVRQEAAGASPEGPTLLVPTPGGAVSADRAGTPEAPTADRVRGATRSRGAREADLEPIRHAVRSEPEVLVPPGQEEALARYVRLLRQRRVEPGSLPAQAVSAEVDLPAPEPLEVRSIAVGPLAMGSVYEEGSGS